MILANCSTATEKLLERKRCTWCYGVDPDTDAGEVSGDGQRHGHDGTLAGCVRDLAALSVVGRDARCVDDDAALTALVRFVLMHHLSSETNHVERAANVHLRKTICFVVIPLFGYFLSPDALVAVILHHANRAQQCQYISFR